MSFRPSPDDVLSIGDRTYHFAEHPAAPGMAYGQTGRRGTVYQLVDENGTAWALKVFLRPFREPRLVGQAERIAPYATLPGLRACERTILTSRRDVEIIRAHSELAYAVLMPWITGKTWLEIVVGKDLITPQDSLIRGRSLVDVLAGLEERGLAHCDLSGPNVILTPEGTTELVDLEEMYGPDLVRPKSLPGGSPGYSHKTAPEGLWRDEVDRFAGAILLAELLGWCDERVRHGAWGEGYFDPAEMQTNCERYHLLSSVINERWGAKLSASFDQMWFSDSLLDCPTFTEWLAVLPDDVPERGGLESGFKMPAREVDEQSVVDGLERDEAAESVIADMEAEDEPVDFREEENWSCPSCGRDVEVNQDVCPYCENGKREEENSLAQLLEVDPEVSRAETKRKRIPIWAIIGGIAVVVVMGVIIGGTLITRSQDVESAATEAAILIAETKATAETATARPTETATPTSTPTLTPTITQTPTATLGVGSTMISEIDGMVMVFVPAGSFLMGSTGDDSNATIDEFPQHEVYLDGFWIDQTEVTNAMYAVFLNIKNNFFEVGSTWLDAMDDGVRIKKTGNEWQALSGYEDHPVVEVTWFGASAYCWYAGRRLPTEAEWEKAARGDDGRIFPWGDESPSCTLANYGRCGDRTSAVGTYPNGASPYGALDMSGNVWEWVADWHGSGYYDDSPTENPVGPSSGDNRVLRGGDWATHPNYIRATYRHWYNPSSSPDLVGFRCAGSS